jgi:Ca-activated chloride channel family protein
MELQDQLYKKYKEAAQKAESGTFPAMDKVWNKVEERLDKEQQRKVIPFRRAGIAAAILVLIALGVYIGYLNMREHPGQVRPGELTRSGKDKSPQQRSNNIAGNSPGTAVQPAKKDEMVTGVSKRKAEAKKRSLRAKVQYAVPQDPLVISPEIAEPEMYVIKGKVVDQDGESVPGASIGVVGSRNGTMTDIDGNYEITVGGKNQKLRIGGIGFKEKEVAVPDPSQPVIAKLEHDDRSLGEVSVTATRIKPEKYSVGSVSVVKAEKVEKRPITDILRALSGSAPGIQVTSGSSAQPSSPPVVVRGFGSLSGNNGPMIVVDGTVYKGSMQTISPENVKSISLLKDAAATSIYGANGANGVIIITTKKQGKNNLFRGIKRLLGIKDNRTSFTDTEAPSIPREPEVRAESYESYTENPFESPFRTPLSTFSIDVDNASYTNIRRFINSGQAVPKDAVRIEEMVNFFKYNYAQPKDGHPFAIYTEYSEAPWNRRHKLLKIGLQGKRIPTENLPASNLVFLIDVSGSIDSGDKLPLLKSSMKLLVEQLREKDKVSIVVYAGAAGLVLPPTAGNRKEIILKALDQLQAGGSTAGGAGIELAYKIAQGNFIVGGNNRVILATDGDFNIGASSDRDMKDLIEEKRKNNVFLTCLGYGMGNYKDSKMEILADKGNGNYAYIDNIQEANRFLVKEFTGTLFSIAKDVKIQIAFNPEQVKAYRLIGYENRKLRPEDFTNDVIDAGELGSGHTVTALYEIIPAGVESGYSPEFAEEKYTRVEQKGKFSNELATIKFRYKKPEETRSIEIVKVIAPTAIAAEKASADFKFSTAVAWFGLKLRDSKLIPKTSKADILNWARQGLANDDEGYKAEFMRLVEALQ